MTIAELQYVDCSRVGPRQSLTQNDIVICIANGSKALVGKNALFHVDDGYEYTFGAFMSCLRVRSDEADPAFVAHLMRSDKYDQLISNALAGSAINNLAPSRIEDFTFLMPAVSEQRVIGAALSDAFAWIESLDALIAKKRDVFEGMRQLLLTNSQRLPGFDDKWVEHRLGDVGSFGGGCGFPTRMQGGLSGIPFYKVSDMNNVGNQTCMGVSRNYVSEEQAKSLGATIFPAGSVVFAKVGAAIFLERKRILAQQSCLDNNMMSFTPNPALVDTSFLHFLLSLIKLSAHSASTALPALNGSTLAKIAIQIPSVDEQRAIASVLVGASAEIDALVAQRDKAELIRQGMAQDLLTGKVRLV